MSLTKSRKVLSFILSLLMAAGALMFFSSQTISQLMINENVAARFLASDSVNNACLENFKDRIKAVEAASGIPSRVFETVLNKSTPSVESSVRNIFSGADTYSYNDDLVSRFEDLCIEYLDGNNMDYDKAQVHNTAVYAAQVYSDCFSIKDSSQLSDFAADVKDDHAKFASVGLLIVVVCIMLISVLFSQKSERGRALASSFSAVGASVFLTGAVGAVVSLSVDIGITPQIYADALKSQAAASFCVMAFLGALILAAATAFLVKYYQKKKKG